MEKRNIKNKDIILKLYRTFFKPFVDKRPYLKRKLNKIWYWNWVLRLKFRAYIQNIDFDWNKIYWINPKQLSYVLKTGFDIYSYKGRILDGDWDLPQNLIKFEDSDVYRAFYQHFIESMSWQDTEFHWRVINNINSGFIKWGCKNKEDFECRLKKLEELYRDIKKNGFKTQEVGESFRKQEDEVLVVIGRDGDLILNNGRHRLCIAKILNLERIPIKITLRHKKWVEFRKEIIDYTKMVNSKVYQPLTHPELSDLTYVWGEERFQIIKKHLTLKNSTLLDIGANWGYFCHKFEEEGFDCYAVEVSDKHLYFLKKLKRAENRRFKIINKSILDWESKIDFDVILALNIFHHFLKNKETYIKFITLLKKLKAKEMFFQPHRYDEPQMKEAYKNYTPQEFVDFILQNSNFKKAEFIGEDKGRPLYKLF